MARGTKLAGESSPFSLGMWIAILEALAKYKLFWVLLVAFQTIRGMIKHYWITLMLAGTLILWGFTGTSIINVLAVASFIVLVALVLIVWLFGGSWKTPYYYMRLKFGWRKAMFGAGLRDREHSKVIPDHYHVRPVTGGLSMRVDLRSVGRGIADLAAEENEVAEVLGAHRGAVGKRKPGIATFVVLWEKELSVFTESQTRKANAAIAESKGDRSKIVFGKTSSGPALLSLLVPLLIIGVSRSGKTTIVKAACQGLRLQKIPHQFYVIDPKGGIALQELENAPNTVAYTKSPAGAKSVIGKAFAEMERRFIVCRERGVDHLDVDEDYPAQVIIIDELLQMPDEVLDVSPGSMLAGILSMGAAVGIVCIAGSQLPQADVIGRVRDLFPQRICLRTSGPDMTDACLGRRAEMNGAKCSQIPASVPGTGYFFSEEEYGLRRFRSIEPSGSFVDGPVVVKERINSNKPCCVYKYYNAVGRAWYFGHALDPEQRAKQHSVTKFWWVHVDHTRTQIIWYENTAAAAEAEIAAIKLEDPVHNRQHRRLEGGKDEDEA